MDVDLLRTTRVHAVRAASRSLAEILDSADDVLASPDPLPDRGAYLALMRSARAEGISALRLAKRFRLLEIAARDLAGEIALEDVGRALADLADACLNASLEAVDESGELAVVAMGKLGARELNYASDIDVMFVTTGDPATAKPVAERLLHELGDFAPEGQAFRIDTNLRPEGRSGALVRSLDGYLEYYNRWAKPWEYQALIKARHAAGAAEAGAVLVERTRSLVFPPEVSAERVASVRKMKERVESHAQRSVRRGRTSEPDDVKLGAGGIRDIEFSVQLLQLVHGGTDESVRPAATLEALDALVDGGYVAEDDGAGLAVAYRWLRAVEHRLQLWQERQVHHLPPNEEDRARVARVMGFKDSPSESALERFETYHRGVLSDVRGRFEKLFYRPMIETLADGIAARLPEESLRDRLRILGFRDVERAARTLSGLVQGSSRRARLFKVLTPALLRSLTATPQPDVGLFGFLTLGEALGNRLDALNALRDNPPALGLLARVLGSGRLLGDVLAQVPEELSLVVDPHDEPRPKERARLVYEGRASLGWREPKARWDGLRRFKRREMLRIAVADVGGKSAVDEVGAALADLADACLSAALDDLDVPLTVIGMGKLGGRELNYSSDVDVMFLHDAEPAAAEKAAEQLMRAIGEVTPEGQAFRVDAALRPEGKAGPLVRSLDSYVEYYERWSRPWEHLALLKARVAAGDDELGARFVAATRTYAHPVKLPPDALAEIRHLKARMERERVPRGTEARRHLKFGPGGLADVEFSAQLLQLEHAHDRPELQVTGTLDALDACWREGLLSDADALRLAEAYRFLMKARNRMFLMAGRPQDALPNKPEELEALGVAMGYTDQPRQELEEDYLRLTRRARKVAERVIYG
ncbi:MAG TPA: bifunctional [glutamine synthetase] adenylyltransferase/[glutamine synthetase]-adenylyl-L-tyrosine phosphorylase [Actinomycetota bacterium]|nr:bifunctional [glutamine synthetase] adenylyltransferase/[glutamine synthetase]-adenylyl-L-tyrosine phosphorylase [Actinomycetota bacterium]